MLGNVIGGSLAKRTQQGVVVPAPDLWSRQWKDEMAAISFRSNEEMRSRFPRADAEQLSILREDLNSSFMHTIFSNVAWYGRERTKNGRRPSYDPKIRTTLDGLPIFIPTEQTVQTMPAISISDEDLNAIRDWITCHHYPGSQ